MVILKEPKNNIGIAFKKAIALDANTICSYIKAMGNSGLDKIIPETFLPFYANCSPSSSSGNVKSNVAQYADANKLDQNLVEIMNIIGNNDQLYRNTPPVNWARQKPLDVRNQQLIDSLYNIYKVYLGKDLVGKQFESVMWGVIQHSSLPMMERYLNVVSDAVRSKQLDEGPLKMLIDRMYWLKYKCQIFGSQGNEIQLADEITRNDVMKKYNLN